MLTGKYDLARIAREQGVRPGKVRMSPIEERRGSVLSYRRDLVTYLRELAKITRLEVLPRLEMDRRMTRDSAAEDWFGSLFTQRTRLEGGLKRAAERRFEEEGARHSRTFHEAAKSALGIDIAALIDREDLAPLLREAAQRNAALITSLGDDAINRVKQQVYSASSNGSSMAGLRKALVKQFEITKRRADLIASDQMAKLNSDMTQFRQEQAGITKYIWRTSQDERVRSKHRALDGKEYAWGKKTDAEEGLAPGKPVRCRCIAIPVIEV